MVFEKFPFLLKKLKAEQRHSHQHFLFIIFIIFDHGTLPLVIVVTGEKADVPNVVSIRAYRKNVSQF